MNRAVCYVYSVVNVRTELINGRDRLKLTQRAAGQLLDPPVSAACVCGFEVGGSRATVTLLEICRAYMREARRRGYDPWPYHESALCPNDNFDEPVRQDDAELERILGPCAAPAGVAR